MRVQRVVGDDGHLGDGVLDIDVRATVEVHDDVVGVDGDNDSGVEGVVLLLVLELVVLVVDEDLADGGDLKS